MGVVRINSHHRTMRFLLLVCTVVYAQACRDEYDSASCKGWARRGECEANPNWMLVNCAESCGQCGGGGGGDEACADEYDSASCKAWAKRGECQANPDWMRPNCAKSCGVCGGGDGGNDGGNDGGSTGGGGNGERNVITEETKKFIVDRHNELRAGVSPAPSNMIKMYWNDRLAELAAENANTCAFQHDDFPSLARKAGMGIQIGQNLAFGYDNWEQALKDGWYDEVKDFQYGRGSTGGMVSHFVMMTLARSSLVGCAYAACEGQYYKKNFACNYAFVPDGSTETPRPWKSGAKCSECAGSCDNGLCDIGPNLPMDCSKGDSDDCSWYQKDNCYTWTNVAPMCPKMCGAC